MFRPRCQMRIFGIYTCTTFCAKTCAADNVGGTCQHMFRTRCQMRNFLNQCAADNVGEAQQQKTRFWRHLPRPCCQLPSGWTLTRKQVCPTLSAAQKDISVVFNNDNDNDYDYDYDDDDNDSDNDNNNNNNHYTLGTLRFYQHVDSHQRGLLPPACEGESKLVNIPYMAIPAPRSPAQFHEDTTYAWSPVYDRYLYMCTWRLRS